MSDIKWIVKLIAEEAPGHTIEHEIATLEREDLLTPATLGLIIAEGKVILEGSIAKILETQILKFDGLQ